MRTGLFATCLLLAACDPLASKGYVGEPMFTLVGTLSTTSPDETGGVALMWQDTGGAGGPGVAVTTVPVEIAFPSTFHVAVPLPPPDAARFAFDDSPVEIAEAYVYVVGDLGAARPSPRGLDRTHVLVYATGDVAAGTLAADYLGGPVTAGYHLRTFGEVATPGAAQQTMIDRCAASGSTRAACGVRRGYQLRETADDDYLRIVVSPP